MGIRSFAWQKLPLKPKQEFVIAAMLRPEEGSLDHVVPRSRGGKDAWENLVWSAKEVNQKKADRLPHEAGLKLLSVPRAPKELPVSALIRNTSQVEDWKLFLT